MNGSDLTKFQNIKRVSFRFSPPLPLIRLFLPTKTSIDGQINPSRLLKPRIRPDEMGFQFVIQPSSFYPDQKLFFSSPIDLSLPPLHLKLQKSSRHFRIQLSVATDSPPPLPSYPQTQQVPPNSPQRLLKELAQRKKTAFPRKKIPPRQFILKPPLDDAKLTERFLKSPQLSLKSFPLLSSCLPPSPLNIADKTWIDEYLLEAKQALG